MTCEAAEILYKININFKIGKLYLLYIEIKCHVQFTTLERL